jgi:hypothetical protein
MDRIVAFRCSVRLHSRLLRPFSDSFTANFGEGPKGEVRRTHGSATLNRGQAAHSISNSHRGLRPRQLGNSAGGTAKVNNSSIVQR